jgi:putative radical SAM enzyme (TIGR03279 family)
MSNCLKNTNTAVIKCIADSSVASLNGLREGDVLLAINDVVLQDILDYRYLIAEEEFLSLKIARDGEVFEIDIEKEPDEDLGLEFEDVVFNGIKRCKNKCQFCFVSQMPPKMRKSLYVKDDDYRLSFLYGSYITLSNLTQEDYDKIFEYHLSPLYISVHSTTPKTRIQLMQREDNGNILEALEALTEEGISLFTQAVVCPGINDGEDLQKTVEDLAGLYPGVQALGVVPVGLTDFREKLPDLTLFNQETAKQTVHMIHELRDRLMDKIGTPFVHMGDEFYLKADIPFPEIEAYEDFGMLENGIGLCRLFLEEFKENYEKSLVPATKSCGIITGQEGARFFTKYIWPLLDEKHKSYLKLIEVKNQTFGKNVTVTGLLGGQEILQAMQQTPCDSYLIPDCCLKHDSTSFLDDMTLQHMQEQTKGKVILVQATAEGFLEGAFQF